MIFTFGTKKAAFYLIVSRTVVSVSSIPDVYYTIKNPCFKPLETLFRGIWQTHSGRSNSSDVRLVLFLTNLGNVNNMLGQYFGEYFYPQSFGEWRDIKNYQSRKVRQRI